MNKKRKEVYIMRKALILVLVPCFLVGAGHIAAVIVFVVYPLVKTLTGWGKIPIQPERYYVNRVYENGAVIDKIV